MSPLLPVAVLVLASLCRGEDAAVAAARARQDAVKSAVIEFEVTEVVARGGLSAANPTQQSRPIPPEETTLRSTARLLIDGARARYENNHPRQFGHSWRNGQFIGVNDGRSGFLLLTNGVGSDPTPLGSIQKDPRVALAAHSVSLDPLTMTFRGLDPTFTAHPLSSLKPTGGTLEIDGKPCAECAVNGEKNHSTQFWLDSTRGYTVRRIRAEQRFRTSEHDVRYRQDPVVGWVPVSWTCKTYSSAGVVLRTATVEIVRLQLNTPQPAEQFALVFPPGTLVGDRRNEKTYRVDPDGEMREVIEDGPPKPADSRAVEPDMGWGGWVVVGGALLAIGVGWFLTRGKRARNA